MRHAHARGGWTVSEVEQLTGLSRRDIQRCCYQGKGGVGILEPYDSSWGRRSYSTEDLATLYLVYLEKRSGLSLPEVSQKIHALRADGNFDTLNTLTMHGMRFEEQIEELSGNVLSIAVLGAACSENSQECIGDLVERALTRRIGEAMGKRARAVSVQQNWEQWTACDQANRESPCPRDNFLCGLSAGWLTAPLSCALAVAEAASTGAAIRDAAQKTFISAIDCLHVSNDFLTCVDAREAIVFALAAPGMNLAFELWLGPGSYEYVTQAIR